jgi:peptidyl-prolyl cis-trans isomerase SurA
MNRIALSVIAIPLLVTVGSAQRTIDRVVAQVNNEVVLLSELKQQELLLRQELSAELQGRELDDAVVEASQHSLRDLIDRSLLRQKGDEFGIRTDLEVIRTMEQMRQEYNFETLEDLEAAISAQGTPVEFFKDTIRTQYLTQQVLQREVYPKVLITTEEIRGFYEANLDEFDRPAGIQLQEIVFSIADMTAEELEDVRAQAELARSRVDSGEEFAVVAAEVSEAPSGPSGGSLGFFATGNLRSDYEEIAANLDRGDISEVVELPGELVILRLQNRHEGGIMSFDLARSEIESFIFSERVEPEVRKYLTTLREEGFVSVRDGYTDTGAP